MTKQYRSLPAWLEIIPIFVLLLFWGYSLKIYPQLPATIPTHFGLGGTPDAWSDKSWGTVLLMPIVTTIVYIGMMLLNRLAVVKNKNFPKYINLPADTKEMSPAALKNLQNYLGNWLFFLNLGITLFCSYLGFQSLQTSLGAQGGVGWAALIFVIFTIAACIQIIAKTISLIEKAE